MNVAENLCVVLSSDYRLYKSLYCSKSNMHRLCDTSPLHCWTCPPTCLFSPVVLTQHESCSSPRADSAVYFSEEEIWRAALLTCNCME